MCVQLCAISFFCQLLFTPTKRSNGLGLELQPQLRTRPLTPARSQYSRTTSLEVRGRARDGFGMAWHPMPCPPETPIIVLTRSFASPGHACMHNMGEEVTWRAHACDADHVRAGVDYVTGSQYMSYSSHTTKQLQAARSQTQKSLGRGWLAGSASPCLLHPAAPLLCVSRNTLPRRVLLDDSERGIYLYADVNSVVDVCLFV